MSSDGSPAMRAWACACLIAGCTTVKTANTSPVAGEIEVRFIDGATQIAMPAEALVWGKCPPTLPLGCEMAVLEGDPRQAQLFTARFRTNQSFELKPHWHPRNERVTILEGNVGVGFGDTIDRDNVTWFGPGDYYVNAQRAHHYVLTDGPALLQITGIGPWKANFLEPGTGP